MLAPEEARVTGEEAERAAFSGEGVLYEFSAEVRASVALGLVIYGMHWLGGLDYLLRCGSLHVAGGNSARRGGGRAHLNAWSPRLPSYTPVAYI